MAQNIDKKPTILFIDSDREAVEIARMVLENAFEVLVAETGEIGLMTAFNSKPSIILLDSYLPEMDGYRICKILRSQEETKKTPMRSFPPAPRTPKYRDASPAAPMILSSSHYRQGNCRQDLAFAHEKKEKQNSK